MHSSIIGGSTAKRRLNCPGSSELEAAFPDPPASHAALEGTALHTVMEDWLAGIEPQLGDYLSDTVPALQQEQLDACKWCYDAVDDLLLPDIPVTLEKYLAFPGIEGAGGTCDVVVEYEDKYTLVDYKFGRGVKVVAEDNSQLLFYAACIRNELGPKPLYELHILQPRLVNHTTWTVTDARVRGFIDKVQKAVENFRPIYKVGDWCRFCKAETVCPAKVAIIKQQQLWQDVVRDKLPQAMAIVEEVESWAHAVRKLAYEVMEEGHPIQGWKIVDKFPRTTWALDDEVVMRKLQRLGVRVNDRAPRKIITPSQAKKLLKARGKELPEGMVKKESSGTTLVREDDPRDRKTTQGSISDLGEMLNAKRKMKNGE